MKTTPAEIQKALSILEDTPRRLTRSTSRANAARLRLKPDPRGWSAVDVLSHLRACADVWGSSIVFMLTENEPTLPDLHPRQWVKQTNYPEILFAESLKAFTRQRENLLEILQELPFEDWSRGATIGGRRHTVFSQVRRMAKHEVEHCIQVEALLAE